MLRSRKILLMCGVAAAGFCLSATLAQGALVNLQAYIVFSLFQSDGTTALPDGSIVQILGSTDGSIDPMQEYGTTGDYFAQPTGDDIIIGTIVVDSTILGIDGTFYTGGFYYDNTVVDYMYIRFFDTTISPIVGNYDWGQSPIFDVDGLDDGVMMFMDFGGSYTASSNDTFVAIPEPSTASLLLLFAGLLCGVRAGMMRGPEEKKISGTGEIED
ncbi:MAG: hypothetical protein PHD86_06010 [Kiritimatiellae bacterium]|nr:hypothetical protein [Kiritimatiellia bacterium]